MAVTTSTPSLTKVATEYNYLASLNLAEGFFKPEISSNLTDRYGQQDITGFLDMIGATNPISHIKFSHYENDRIHGTFRLSASAASAAATSAAFQLVVGTTPATGQYSYNGQDPYTTTPSFTTYMPQVYDVIEVNGFQALITFVSGNTASAIALNSAETRPAIAATDDFIIIGSALPEGSSGMESRNSQMLTYTNYLQIFRRNHKVTNTAANVVSWVEVEGPGGKKGYYWHLKGIVDEMMRFRNEREASLIAGKGITNPAGLASVGTQSFGDANSITMTKGLIPQISADGNVEAYTAGSFGLTDIENMVVNLNKFRGSRENMLAVGHSLSLDIDALFRGSTSATGTFDAAAAGGIQFAAFQPFEKQGVKFEFDAFSYGGYKFAVKVMDIFSDPTLLGYAGGIYSKLGMVIPLGNTVTYNDMNSRTSAIVPSLRVNYLDGPDGGSRYQREWVTGYGQGVATSNNDFFEVNWLSHCGLEAFALNRYGLFVG